MANGTGPSAPCCFGRAPYPKQWKLTNLTAPANSACENCDSWTPAAQYILDQQPADPCALWENNNLNDGPDCNGVETINFVLYASLADNGKMNLTFILDINSGTALVTFKATVSDLMAGSHQLAYDSSDDTECD